MGFPSGRVTFVFTDIEGSTALLRRVGEARFTQVLERHRELIRAALAECDGREVKTEGDGFFVVFGREADAVRFCAAAQRSLALEAWPQDALVRVRMGLHSGEADLVNDDYVGLAVHQAARVSAAAHGGQVLLTQEVLDRASCPADVQGFLLGSYRLKDFPEPIALFELRGEGLPAEFPALRAIPAAAHNVPVILSSFVGRDRELTELSNKIRSHRIVTVTGAGGAGKTRLAFEVTASLAGQYADGAWVVLLAALEHSDGVDARIAQVLGAREEPGVAILETLGRHLGDREALLVVDNCEHLVDAAARVIGVLLARCPRLTVLATSRQPLRLAGEYVWRLPPMSLPAGAVSDLAVLAEVDAVRLFLERAQVNRREFALTDQTAGPVVAICQQLDGIPLAIELAAARLAHLDIAEIAARLGDRLRLLTGGSRDALPRHQTLRATVDWSHEQLSDPERILFRRLCVFRSRFSLTAAEQVCADASLPEAEVLDSLAGLVDKSLVSVADDELGLRYRMLAVLSEYAHEQLAAAGEQLQLQRRHAEHLAESEGVQKCIRDEAPSADGLELLRSSQDDLRAAFDFALAQADGMMAYTFACAWSRYAFTVARYRAARSWCEQALTLLQPGGERAAILYRAGLLAVCDDDLDISERHISELLDYATRVSDGAARFRAHHVLGDIALKCKDAETARRHYLAALDGPAPTSTGPAAIRRSLGAVAGLAGEAELREPAYRAALAEVTELGASFEMARCGVDLGWLLACRGSTEAVDILREALRSSQQAGAPGAGVAAIAGLGILEAAQGRRSAALTLIAAAEGFGAHHDASVRVALRDYFFLQETLEQCLADCREHLAPQEYDSAWQRGLAADPIAICDEIFGAVATTTAHRHA